MRIKKGDPFKFVFCPDAIPFRIEFCQEAALGYGKPSEIHGLRSSAAHVNISLVVKRKARVAVFTGSTNLLCPDALAVETVLREKNICHPGGSERGCPHLNSPGELSNNKQMMRNGIIKNLNGFTPVWVVIPDLPDPNLLAVGIVFYDKQIVDAVPSQCYFLKGTARAPKHAGKVKISGTVTATGHPGISIITSDPVRPLDGLGGSNQLYTSRYQDKKTSFYMIRFHNPAISK
ncbi:MAG TPA: hypothetical protein PLK82_00665 [Bacteroidales bacterium]|nr:hypothetical protein [Bacteroidales bacterium]